jgi:hypothetical protein
MRALGSFNYSKVQLPHRHMLRKSYCDRQSPRTLIHFRAQLGTGCCIMPCHAVHHACHMAAIMRTSWPHRLSLESAQSVVIISYYNCDQLPLCRSNSTHPSFYCSTPVFEQTLSKPWSTPEASVLSHPGDLLLCATDSDGGRRNCIMQNFGRALVHSARKSRGKVSWKGSSDFAMG